jgi:excinuclease ABC subunit B
VEVFPAHDDERAIRIEFFGDTVDAVSVIDPLRGVVQQKLSRFAIYPASHYVANRATQERAVEQIRLELEERLRYFKSQNMLLEAQRIEQRTFFDIEMIEEMGFCQGIENYSRHFDGRRAGDPPYTLIDYFPDDYMLVIDESHITVPQVGGMYRGDRSRKETLVNYGFRLPSALDNRPLTFQEFQKKLNQVVYVSATPADFELKASGGVVVEQVIRPTGLIDPAIEVRPAAGQVDDLLHEARETAARGERVLVTTLTKRMAEELTDYYRELGIRVKYLHSDIDTFQRMQILRELRLGEYDVLVGINLLREGLDLPEVSLVAILDADKEGFLRSTRSLIQTCGRAARNVSGRVIMYADKVTGSMRDAIDETLRRRAIQEEYNAEHGITPESVKRVIGSLLQAPEERDYVTVPVAEEELVKVKDLPKLVKKLRKEMLAAAKEMEFERAAELRDRIKRLETAELTH